MKAQFDDNLKKLTLFFPKKVDSANSEKVKEEIITEISKYDSKSIIINMADTCYVSSAGLRVLLSINKIQPNIRVTEVNSDVYEILDMTGFAGMLKVERRMKEYSVDNLEMIGKGATAIVYRIDQDTIIKVFGNNLSFDEIERERSVAKAAFLSGIATAIPYEVVKVGESYGTIYEMIKADTLARFMNKNPETFEENVKRFGKFMREMDAIEIDSKLFPSAKSRYLSYYAEMEPMLDDDMKKIAYSIINAIPDKKTFSHGDFHFNNVLTQNEEFVLIDMGEASCGSPIIDIMSFGCSRIYAEFLPDEYLSLIFGMTACEVKRAWDIFLKAYFNNATEEELVTINKKCLLFSGARVLYSVFKIKKITAAFKDIAIAYVRNLYNEELLDLNFLE